MEVAEFWELAIRNLSWGFVKSDIQLLKPYLVRTASAIESSNTQVSYQLMSS